MEIYRGYGRQQLKSTLPSPAAFPTTTTNEILEGAGGQGGKRIPEGKQYCFEIASGNCDIIAKGHLIMTV